MNMTVEEIRDAVLGALEHAGYSSATVADYAVTFGQLAKASDGGEYTTAVGAAFASVTTGPAGAPYAEKTLSKRRRVVRIADEYVATGSIDLRRARGLNPPPMPRSPHLIKTLGLYAEDNVSRGLATGTCEFYWRLAREFALYVESLGAASFDEARAGCVLMLTNPAADQRTWVWAHLYAGGTLEITSARTPGATREVLATGRVEYSNSGGHEEEEQPPVQQVRTQDEAAEEGLTRLAIEPTVETSAGDAVE